MQDQFTPLAHRCIYCGKPIVRYHRKHPGRITRYCSTACSNRANSPDRSVAWFLSMVPYAEPQRCQPFQGGLDTKGYGRFMANGVVVKAHRFAYELAHGPGSANGQQVHHLCNNPPCCNPAHLILGNNASNIAWRIACGRPAKITRS